MNEFQEKQQNQFDCEDLGQQEEIKDYLVVDKDIDYGPIIRLNDSFDEMLDNYDTMELEITSQDLKNNIFYDDNYLEAQFLDENQQIIQQEIPSTNKKNQDTNKKYNIDLTNNNEKRDQGLQQKNINLNIIQEINNNNQNNSSPPSLKLNINIPNNINSTAKSSFVSAQKLNPGGLTVNTQNLNNQNNNKQSYSNVRLYQIWPGNNRIFCNGYLMSGSKNDIYKNIGAWSLILLVSVFYIFMSVPFLYNNIHPSYPITVLFSLLQTIIFFIFVQFSDPGIIPRKYLQDITKTGEELYQIDEDGEEIQTTTTPNLRHKKFRNNNNSYQQNQQRKMCQICKIVKPVRSSHCAQCGNCIEVFDHHCPYMNNCIGKRNYKYFIGFLISLIFTSLGMLSGFLIQIFANFGQGITNSEVDEDQIVVKNKTLEIILLLILGIPTVFFTICLLMYSGFHIYLICKGATTKEKLGNRPVILDDTQQRISLEQRNQNKFEWLNKSKSKFNLRQLLTSDMLTQLKQHEQYQKENCNNNILNLGMYNDTNQQYQYNQQNAQQNKFFRENINNNNNNDISKYNNTDNFINNNF